MNILGAINQEISYSGNEIKKALEKFLNEENVAKHPEIEYMASKYFNIGEKITERIDTYSISGRVFYFINGNGPKNKEFTQVVLRRDLIKSPRKINKDMGKADK